MFLINHDSFPDFALHHIQIAINLAKKSKNYIQLIKLYNELLKFYYPKSEWSQCLKYGDSALNLALRINDSVAILRTRTNIGVIYYVQGNQNKALKNYLISLQYLTTTNQIGKGNIYINIGMLYRDMGNDSLAKLYLDAAIEAGNETKDTSIITKAINNIGLIFKNQGKYIDAIAWYNQGIKLAQLAGQQEDQADMIYNLSYCYKGTGDYTKAMDYATKSLQITKEMGDDYGLSAAYLALADIANMMKKNDLMRKYLSYCESNAAKYNNIQVLAEMYKLWSEYYEKTGNYKKAAESLKSMIQYKDSLNVIQDAQKLSALQTKFFIDMQTREDSLKAISELKLHNLELSRKDQQLNMQRIYTWGSVLVSILALVSFFSLFKAFRQKKHDNLIISAQKEIVEVKNKEILDSITYAKRLQQAILPPFELLKEHLPHSFVLYKPKDIVAGDFYWMEAIDEFIFIAAADCTGHGVPGAMVSVVCSNALYRTVNECNIRETGKILDTATDLVLETFEKSGGQINDGMDISLLAINTVTKQIQWSGANTPLWYFQNASFIEIKANKQPIGKFESRMPFTTHYLNNSSNVKENVFYLFTDGFPDQFGGPKGKKFMYKRFKDKLADIHKLQMDDQKEKLEKELNEWKGNLEQVDDITVIGIRL